MNRQLDDAVARLRNELSGLRDQEREDVECEIRGHLEDLVARFRATGLSERDATARALRDFGDVARVGREVRSVKLRGTMLRPVLIALGVYEIVFAINLAVFTSDGWSGRLGPLALLTWWVAAGPFLGGLVTGRFGGRRAVPATAVVFSVYSGLFVLLDALASTDPGEWKGVLLASGLVSLPLACLGAFLARRARETGPEGGRPSRSADAAERVRSRS